MKASLLWGLVGALAFLALVQGYELLAQSSIGLAPKSGVALFVFAAAAGLSYLGERHLGAGAS